MARHATSAPARRSVRRSIGVAIATAALLGTVTGCSGASHDRSVASGPDTTVGADGSVPSGTGTDGDATTVPATVDPGTLPQTHDRPVSSGPELAARTQALWQGIVDDNTDTALTALFPLTAYRQVKDLRNPDSDWHDRIAAAFVHDIHAMHAELGSQAGEATLVGLVVPDVAAVWVNPHEEYNKLGYWRVYGSSLQYSVGGKTRKLPIYSLISWRGEWYVVHASSSDPMSQVPR
jgi:hypothetical protein